MIREETVQKAIAQLKKRSANVTYFFDQLKSPDWIEPLYKAGFFRNPPAPIQEGNTISFSIWPESRYLVRMAPLASENVQDILIDLPDTENLWVHSDILDAAAKMPPASIAALVDKEIKWINSRKHVHFLGLRSVTALIDHLIDGNQTEVALRLTQAVLAFRRDDDAEEKSQRRFRNSSPVIEDYYYKEILGQQIPKLVALAGMDALNLLCAILQQGIRAYLSEDKIAEEDHSDVWRPSIADHVQNSHHFDVKGDIAASIRDAGNLLLSAKKIDVESLVKMLESRQNIIFQRLALYFLSLMPEQHVKAVEEHLTNHALFTKSSVWHEYYNLLEVGFGCLNKDAQNTILGWIEAGPDTERYRKNIKSYSGKDISDEELKGFVIHWQLRRLMPIHKFLDAAWSQRYQEWIAQEPLPGHPDFNHYSTGVMHGPNSPTDADTLAAMSIEALVAHLKELKFSDQFMGPSPEGLARVLTPLVAKDAERFAISCAAFKECDPTYVRAILNGLQEAVKKPVSFNWEPVLEFCKWIVDQPRTIEGRVVADDFHQDCDWGNTRSVIARLLSAGFGEGEEKNVIPFALRTLCWDILYPLTNDPDPSREQEIKYGNDYSPINLSINTTRGDAMHTVFRYILWVDRHLYGGKGAKDKPKLQFKKIPEVEAVLDGHLVVENDATACTRAVYGQWMHTLVWFGRDWVVANLDKLFPAAPEYKYLRDACWETFLECSQPYVDFFMLFEAEYKKQIDELGKEDKKKKRSRDWEEFYVGHLAIYQGLGCLPKEMLDNFYAKASASLRKHVIDYLGRSLAAPGDVPANILARIKSLWEFRLAACTTNTNLADEITPFGWWLESRHIDKAWGLDQLHQVLKLTHGKITPDFEVIEYLAEMAPTAPDMVVDCLKLMIDGDREGWFIQSHQEHIRTILKTCLSSDNGTVAEKATQLIHKIGARGIAVFRDLLAHLPKPN